MCDIILPETMRTLWQEDSSVLAALIAVQEIVSNSALPIDQLLRQLDAELLGAIMGIQNGPSVVLEQVKSMQVHSFILARIIIHCIGHLIPTHL